jgi:hypothetical protein
MTLHGSHGGKKTAKLFGADGKLVAELDLPEGFIQPPAVIFYGTRAFLGLLAANGQYSECSCWRAAPKPAAPAEKQGELF